MSPRRKKQGPSPAEIRMRAELDRLRRELGKLKKEGGAPDSGEGSEESEPRGGAATRLARRVAELEQSQSRLSRLYFSQLDEKRRHAARLHEILRAVSEISADLDLDSLLERIAAAIQTCIGFRIVFIRLREPGGERLRPAAFVGLAQGARAALQAEEVRIDDLRSWLRDECKVGRSYFIGHKHPFNRQLPRGYVPDLGKRQDWEWHGDDVLLTPLMDSRGELMGYVSVDDPADRLVPSQDTIELLEVLVSHAVVAIENARRMQGAPGAGPQESPERTVEIDRLKHEFLSAVAHELRTPLTVVQAFTDTILLTGIEKVTPERLREFVRVVDEEARRLARLMDSVLDLARFDASRANLRRQPTDFIEVVDEALWLLGRMAQARRVELKVARELADTELDADRDQLRQLVLHLGGNAIKFTPQGGRVTVRVAGDAEQVTLEVEDTGIGIPEEALGRIFDRSQQADSSLVRRFGGGGLGLAICKSIVEGHEGTVTARSQPGKGSTFTVTLPRHVRPRVVVRPNHGLSAATQDVLRLAVEMVSEVMDAGVVSLMASQEDGTLAIEAAIGLESAVLAGTRVRPGVGVSGWVAQNRRPLCVSSPERAEVPGSGRDRYATGTFLSVPLESGERFLGVINVTDPASRQAFQIEDCHLLLELAHAVAHAWRGAAAAAADQPGPAGTAEALRHVLERVRLGRHHRPERVERARAVAELLDLPPSEVALIGFAAAGTASFRFGDRPSLETMGAAREILLSLHEWWDGTGYPRGLSGAEIPVGTRVLAVVDAFERPAPGHAPRPARSRAEAFAEIRRHRGTQFDPDVVDALGRLLSRREAGEAAALALPATSAEGR